MGKKLSMRLQFSSPEALAALFSKYFVDDNTVFTAYVYSNSSEALIFIGRLEEGFKLWP